MKETREIPMELDDRPDLHRRGWLWQTILWILLALVIAAGSVGVFGGGPVAQRTAGQKGSDAWVKYEQLARRKAPTHLELHWKAPTTGISVVQIPTQYLKHFQIESITPQPAAVRIHEDMVAYSFAGTGRLTVVFHLQPETAGNVEGSLQILEQTFDLHHFIYP